MLVNKFNRLPFTLGRESSCPRGPGPSVEILIRLITNLTASTRLVNIVAGGASVPLWATLRSSKPLWEVWWGGLELDIPLEAQYPWARMKEYQEDGREVCFLFKPLVGACQGEGCGQGLRTTGG